MNKVPCPGCGALLELEQEVCSSCRRPRDEREIEEGRNRLSELALKQRRLPRIIAAWILVAISAAGYKTGQLEDSDPPYRERTEEQRRSAFTEIAPSDLEPPSIRSRRSASLVPFDIVLIRDEPAKTDPAP